MANPLDAVGLFHLVKDMFKVAGHPEQKLEQQVAGTIPALSNTDEAIESALDQFMGTKNPLEMAAITAVRLKLKPHQRSKWRAVYTSLKLTEKFENFLLEEEERKEHEKKDIENPGKVEWPRPPGAQPGILVPGKTESTDRDKSEVKKKWARFARDYEFTDEDPRILYLRYVAKLVLNHANQDDGVQAAINYLIAAEHILEKSAREKAADVLDSAYLHTVKLQIDEVDFDAIMALKNISEEERRARFIRASRAKRDTKTVELQDEKKESLPKEFWITIGALCAVGILVVIAITLFQYFGTWGAVGGMTALAVLIGLAIKYFW